MNPVESQTNVRRITTYVREKYVNCSWCGKIKDRMTQEPLAEGPIKKMVESFHDSHGACDGCATKVRTEEIERRLSSIPPARAVA